MIRLSVGNVIGRPAYRQLYEQIVGQILRGEILPDECLPSIRSVAEELRISVVTVKTAYEMLESGGYIYTVAGKGCFVKGGTHDRVEHARGKLREDLTYYRNLGLTKEELLNLVDEEYD